MRQRSWSVLLILLFIHVELAPAQKTFYDQQFSNWQNDLPPADSTLYHSVFLTSNIYSNNMLNLLSLKLENGPKQSSLLFLGNIISPYGLPDSEADNYESAKTQLDAIVQSIDHFQGQVIFLPGHDDWDNGGENGLEHVLNEQDYLQNITNDPDIYQPLDGCPGPVEIPLAQDIVAIVFDSQWWFHKYEKSGPDDDCGFEDKTDILVQLEDMIRRNEEKKIIFATHHPLFSAGNHGGYFHPSRWVFPLLDVSKYLYLPLPGFLYTGYRKYLGGAQDLSHPDYKNFRTMLLDIFNDYPNIMYAAGHEQNMQYVERDGVHHIISSGGDHSYIAKKAKETDFAAAAPGLSILNFYENGDVWIEFWTGADQNSELIFRHKLFNQTKPDMQTENVSTQTLADSTVRVKITDIYNRGKFLKFWIGEGYRDVWNEPVTFPVFDIRSKKGGLKILQLGGGLQSRSIRMENPNGKQYVLRSANKNAAKLLGPKLQNTIAQYTLQDAISSSNPYGALTIPKLADAAGIMHTNPQLV